MTITVSRSDNENTVTLNISGSFDFSVHNDFRNAYKDNPPEIKYIINMRNTKYMDSSALGMLLLLREHAGSGKSTITIEGCQGDIQKVFTISNFHKLFNIK